MIRKFNYTGRLKIARERVTIGIIARDGQIPEFSADVRLDGLKLPGDAEVCIEAYRNASWMRFPFGTVGMIIPPDNRKLTGFDDPDLLFRLKVIDQRDRLGRILAEAREISPTRPEDSGKNRISLLWVEGIDLGDRLWRLRLDDEDRPTLQVNQRVALIKEIVRSDPQFQSLVFPEIVRQILQYILLDLELEDPSEDEDIWHCWLRFAQMLPGVPPPPAAAKAETREWIDIAVDAFSRKFRFLSMFMKIHESSEAA